MKPDARIDAVAGRLAAELVDDEGHSADADHVAAVVHAAAEALVDAPIQDFVPLLVENAARDALQDEGLHRTLPADLDGPPPDPDEHPDAGDQLSGRY